MSYIKNCCKRLLDAEKRLVAAKTEMRAAKKEREEAERALLTAATIEARG